MAPKLALLSAEQTGTKFLRTDAGPQLAMRAAGVLADYQGNPAFASTALTTAFMDHRLDLATLKTAFTPESQNLLPLLGQLPPGLSKESIEAYILAASVLQTPHHPDFETRRSDEQRIVFGAQHAAEAVVAKAVKALVAEIAAYNGRAQSPGVPDR